MNRGLFSKLLRKFFGNPFQKVLSGDHKFSGVVNKRRGHNRKPVQVENLEPRLVLSASTAENPLPGLRHEVIFVDSNVPNRQNLVEQIKLSESVTEVVEINASQNGLQQISSYLSGKTNLDAIHVLSHGQQGKLILGSVSIGTNEINSNLDYLATIGRSLTQDGDLLLYGCNISEGYIGQDFVNRLAEVTGADVAASDDATGNILAAGDWDLEQATGPVETTPVVADIGNNTLANYTISIGRNDPKLYYQARSSTPSPASRFTTTYSGWEQYVGANPGPFYVKSYTADNYESYYREVWRDQSVYYPFQGNRTVKVRGYERYSVNVGNGTRFGTQTFTVNAPSTYQIWTTRVAGSIYTDHLGEAKQLGGNNEGPYDGDFKYVTSLYQGSFDPTQPLKNLVAAHETYSFHPQVNTPSYQGEIAYEGELQANTTYVLVVSFAYHWGDEFWYECAPSMLWGDFNVAVTDMNRPPVWDSASLNQTVSGDGVRSFSIPWSKVSDPEGDAITVSARLLVNGQEQNLPSWLTFNPNSMTFSGNAPANTGAINLRLIASDGISSVNKNFVATFTNDNDRPFVATPIPGQTWSGSGGFSYQVPLNTFSDSDPSGTIFSYSATLANGNPLPLWLNFDAATRTFSGNPPANATDLNLRVTANDGSGQGNATFYSDFTLKLLNNNDIPTVSGFTKSFAEDNTLSFTSNDFVLADNDTYAAGGVATTGIGKTLQAVRILSLPMNGTLWLDANADDLRGNGELVAVNQEIITGDLLKLRFTPDSNWVGSTSFTWSGTDGVNYANSTATASITVSLVNDAPVLALSGGRALSLRPNTGNPLVAVTVDPGLTLTDPDTPYTSDAATYDTIYGATVTVVDSTTGNFQSGDVLAATGISGRITVSYNSGSGSLTLSGSATAAEYQQVLRTLAFSSTNTTNDNLRTISISLQTKDVTIPIVANFDGVDDYIETMRASIPLAGDWTVSVWYRADTAMFSSGRDYTILAQGTSDQNFYISKNGTNNLRLGDSWTVNGGMPNDGAWHQITVVKNGTSSTNGTLYIDGIKISTGQLPNTLPGTGMRIGRVYKRDNTQEWGSTYWQGSISDLRVYNRALNGLEVTDSVNSNTRLTGYESNLVSWYPLDGTADNKAAGSWNLGRDFDPRSPTWLQGPWDLGFIDTGTPLSDFPSSPSGNIFRSIDTSTSDPVISGSTRLTVQTSSDINRGKFVFVRNTVENQVSSSDTVRPGEVFTLANNYSTAAQFTAPMSGIYGVDARFWKVFTNGSGDPKYRVYKLSGSTLSEVDGGGVINATNPSGAAISSLKQIVLDQGDKLIFAVTSNGAVNCDEATLYLHVDLLATKITAGSNTYFYSHSNGHYYGISSSSASWDNAKTAAEALTVGGQSGYLATPTDSASMQIMRAILANANVSGAWAGAKQINSNNEPAGNFYWATGPKAGQPFNGSWNSGEPNNYDHGGGVREHHVEITTGNYNDNNGLLARPYVVEFGDSRLPLPGELTGTISANRDPGNAMLFKDANVAYSARSGHYYRVDSTARSWNSSASAAAQTSYESQTGYLARVTSLNELRIAGWFNRLQNQADQWVGLRQTNKTSEPDGGWQWVTGDEAGMTTDESFATPTFWNAGEPNNAWSGTEDYGGMNNYGSGLNDFREVETLGSLIEYGIDGQALSIPLFGFAPNQTVSIKFVSSTALVAVRVGNTGPSASNWSASTSEDTTLSFTAAQFTAGFSDPELDSLASITITGLPSASAGVLKFKGINVTLNQVVLAGELNQLAFVPVADFNGSANFSYTASDGYLSSSAAMVAITVNAVNDRPVLDTAGSPVLATIAEDISSGSNLGTTVSDIVVNGSITDVDVISPSTVPEAIAVTLVDNTNGVWQYKVASGNWTSFSATRDVVSLGASALLLDGTDSIRFLPDANFNGTATFLFRAWDKTSGTAGGTSDPFALGGNTALSVAEETATITVTAVNDAPTTTSKTISFNEDTTYVFTAADFAFADVDAGNTLQSVAITSLPTAGSLTLNNGSADVPVVQSQSISVADITAGKLKFTPVANAFGSSYATMGFTVSDGSASSSPAILTFDVTDTNDAPTAISWATGGSITENTASAQGVVVGTLAATDPNTGDVLSFRRTSNPNFSISPDGTVRYVGVVGLDYEITPTQTLGVTVTDSQGLTYSANVTVTITNVSETAPTIKASNFFAALNSLTTITSSNLCAVDEQESGASLVFTIIEQITGGTLWVDTDGDGTVNGSEKVLGKLTPSSPNVANTFTQADIDSGLLKFRKDNTQTAGGLMVSVSDGNSLTQPTKSLLIIPSSPPVVSPIDDQQWRTSGAQSFKVPDNSFLDPDQDILSVSATKSDNSPLPNWLTFDPATWTFSGTPSGVNAGDVLAIKVTATDGRNPAVSDEFNIQFVQTITAPSVSNPISTQTFQGAGSKTFVVPANTFTDPNSATITYGATQANGTSLPSWLSFDPNTRTFSGNPPASAVPGPLWLKVTGTSSGGSASSVFRLNILDANDFPVETPAGTIPDKTLAGDGEHVFTVHRSAFSDPDGATIFLTARTNNNQALPNWLTFSFDNSTGLGTFKADLPSGTGSQIVRVFANDSLGGSGYADFTINYSGGSNAEPLVLTSNGVSGMNNLNPRGLYTISSGNLASFVVSQGTVKAITTQFLMEADPDDQGTGITFTVTTLPQNGQLWIDSDNSNTINGSESALQVGGTFTQADIDLEKLKYRHTANNAISDSFVFTIADGGEDGSIPVVGVTFPITVAPTPSGAPTLLSVGRPNSAPAITNADTLYFRVVFSEDVNRVDAADFALTGTLASSASILAIQAVSASTYDISVGGAGLANANGILGIALVANPSITNNNGTGINSSVAPLSTVMYTLDNNSPTVSATASVSMHDGSTPFQVTFSFNESVNGISLADFSATNATLGNFVVLYDSNNNPTNQYRITVTPTALQSISVSLAAGAGNDDAGNLTPSASITVLGVITITGPGGSTGSTASVSTPENSSAVYTFSADRSVSWSITGGADASQFTIGSTTGALSFTTAPNFESPSDSNTDNVYVVVIRATDSQNATVDQTISVTVTNVNEAPVISLKREIQETTGLGLTNDYRIYSFYSPESGNAEYGVVIYSPNTGFPDAAAMAAAFQAHPDYNTLPYTITVNGS
ncbi:MAG: DUF4347 domain-containing protein, partial [Planctomycetes bacterium]|nr:DUF4347 domain-containing protein [Planctomycetota bacterium]